jgi:hypothetical protein
MGAVADCVMVRCLTLRCDPLRENAILRLRRTERSVADFCFECLLTSGAQATENRVMTGDFKAGLFLCNVRGHQGYRHIDIVDPAATFAMNVIVAVRPFVEPARLIGKCQFLDEIVLSQQMQRPVHRAIGNGGILPPDPFENLTGCQVPLGTFDFRENDRPLGCISVCAPPDGWFLFGCIHVFYLAIPLIPGPT